MSLISKSARVLANHKVMKLLEGTRSKVLGGCE
jgi:hypothetical protein